MALITSISGIRGTLGGKPGEGLTPLDIVKYTAAYGSWLKGKFPKPTVLLGRDARPTGPMVGRLVSDTLRALGINVIDLGLATTPTVEMAVMGMEAEGGIIISASHNPAQWNALKLLNEKGEFLSAADGQEILSLADQGDFTFAELKSIGKLEANDGYLAEHISAILDLPEVDEEAIAKAKFKVVVDSVNSVGGVAVPALLKALGVEHITELNSEPTGVFAHNPEPLPEHLTQICNELQNSDHDLGIVVDPDVDRLALICENGDPFGEEYTLVAVADYMLGIEPGPTVSNLSSTQALRDVAEKHGQEHHSSAVGEVNVVAKMKEVGARIGGEGNGGVIVPSLHYGRDALAGIALFLTHLAKSGKRATQLRASYEDYHISKNKIELTPELDMGSILDGVADKYAQQEIDRQDGVKIYWDKEWVHLRKSNTEPIIRIYAESSSQSTSQHLANKIISDIKEIITHQV